MIPRVIELCGRHRLWVVALTLLAALLGARSVATTPLDAIPDLSDPQVIVFTEWMGRSPTQVEDQVTYPIVAQLLSAPAVTDVRGVTMFGMSFIYVVFEEGTDIYWARARVLEYLNTLQGSLPPDATPRIGPDATGVGWVFEYALVDRSGTHDLADLRSIQDFSLRYALASVPGVAEVASVGGYQKQYQVTVDPERLRAYGVSLSEVTSAIRRANAEAGGRVLEMSEREYYVRGRGSVTSKADLENVALRAVPGGAPILVGSVGTVTFGPDIRRGLVELDGEGEAVGGIVVMRHGENARAVIERVKARLVEYKDSLPAGVDVVVTYDRSSLIDRSIVTLRSSLTEEMLVVALVIAVFLLHLRSTLVAVIAIPLGILIAFVPMRLLGMSSNIMSLGGIAIAIGAMVDAAIVMVENAHKKLENAPEGADRHALLIEAAKEVGPAIFFSLLIITVSFLPIFTLPGQAGRLFKPLAFTKTFVMASAALLSITLIPALLELLIRGRVFHEKDHPVSRLLIGAYRPFVWVALRNPKTTLLIGALAFLSAIPLVGRLGSEFMPTLNEGDLLYMPITFPNISIEEAKTQLQMQDRLLKETPEILRVFGKAGRAETPTDPAPLSMVETVAMLKPPSEWRRIHVRRWWSFLPSPLSPPFRAVWPDERTITWDELMAELGSRMQLAGWTNAWTMPVKTRIDMLSTGIRTPIGVKIYGRNLEEIEKAGMQMETVLGSVSGTRSVFYERNLGGLYVDIVPDREALARYGLGISDVNEVVEAALGGSPVTTTVEGRERFTVNVRYPRDFRGSLEKIREILVPVGGGTPQGAGMKGMGKGADARPAVLGRTLFAQADMGGMNMRTSTGRGGAASTGMSASPGMATDAMPSTMPRGSPPETPTSGAAPTRSNGEPEAIQRIPLGQLADVRITNGPPMIRDEGGLLVGYVFVDIDTATRDIGGYVAEAKSAVAAARGDGRLVLPAGTFLKWTGQYELLEVMARRMRIVVPLTLGLVLLLLFLQFRNPVEVLVVVLSIPFALIGSVWLLFLLKYRLSTAVWVGIIALVGLAAQTGIVMIVYIDHAYHRRKKEGRIRDLDDIIAATLEGTVQRVRPKLMTVSTMMIGLVPLLWATGSGADVMRRIAAPMVGGLLTSAFLTLELIPVIVTHWRHEQLLWERVAERDDAVLRRLQHVAHGLGGLLLLAFAFGAASSAAGVGVATIGAVELVLAAVLAAGCLAYRAARVGAVRMLAQAHVRW